MSLYTMSGGAAAANLDLWNINVDYKIIQISRHAKK